MTGPDVTHYKGLDDIVAQRLEALLAEERDEYTSTCCTACRRGTKAHGVLPCGRDLKCPCHRTETTR